MQQDVLTFSKAHNEESALLEDIGCEDINKKSNPSIKTGLASYHMKNPYLIEGPDPVLPKPNEIQFNTDS